MSLGPPGGQFDPEQANNLEAIELLWADDVGKHIETYWSLLESKRGSDISFTEIDDEIYEHLKEKFPLLIPPVILNENDMKSNNPSTGKPAWFAFITHFEKKVEDSKFGTMVRRHVKGEYSPENAILVSRVQFYAIEIARNRAGLNDWVYEKAQKEREEKS